MNKIKVLAIGENSFLSMSFVEHCEKVKNIECITCSHGNIPEEFEIFDWVVNFSINPRFFTESYSEKIDQDLLIAKKLSTYHSINYLIVSSRLVYDNNSFPELIDESHDTVKGKAKGYRYNKIISENNCAKIINKDRLLIIRASNVFGLEAGRHTFMGIAQERLISKSEILLDVSKKTIRDFIPVSYFSIYLSQLIINKCSGIYNVGSGFGFTLEELCNEIIQGYEKGNIIEHNSVNIRDQFILNSDKLQESVGYGFSKDKILNYAREIGEKMKKKQESCVFKKIVITGAAGFVGSHVYDHFRNKYPNSEILILDKMTYAADIRNIPDILTNPMHRLVVGDVSDLSICLQATKDSDLVIHLAAESHVDNSFGNSMIFTKSNTLGTHAIMEACKRNKVKKIIHVSTDEVYGENIKDLFLENDELNPTNPYSAAKAGAEMLVKSYFRSFEIPVVIVRANNIYGIRQFPEKIIPRFSLRAIAGLPLTIHGNGANMRHYLAASDFAKALDLLSISGNCGEAYNIASEFELSNLDMASLINGIIRPGVDEIEFVKDRPFNDFRYAVDDSKLRELGWSPQRNIIKDMPEIINWYVDNKDRYRDVEL